MAACPALSITKLLVSLRDPSGSTVYAGTGLGVYDTTDGGASWHLYGSGLPMVVVSDLYMPTDGSYLCLHLRARRLGDSVLGERFRACLFAASNAWRHLTDRSAPIRNDEQRGMADAALEAERRGGLLREVRPRPTEDKLDVSGRFRPQPRAQSTVVVSRTIAPMMSSNVGSEVCILAINPSPTNATAGATRRLA
jgi:hypothetical protein